MHSSLVTLLLRSVGPHALWRMHRRSGFTVLSDCQPASERTTARQSALTTAILPRADGPRPQLSHR
eukprot:1995996-Pyramimonas_sp.AAC.1